MRAAGGGRINEAFYLPELRDSLELRPVPEEDRVTIAETLAKQAPEAESAPVESTPVVSLAAMDRLWEGRTVSESAYRARVEPREPASSLAPSEQRHVFFAVSNEGTERWPASLDADPPIRLSYRWLNADGTIHTEDGPRSPFSRAVCPGERILTPLHVDAPPDYGDYHTFHYGADTAIWNVAQAVGSPVVPVDGAVNRISLEGCAEPAAGGPAPLTEFHVQDISPIPNGGERVNLSSQGFQLPVCGAGGASGSSRVYTNGALEARAAARHWWSITSWTMFSSERVGRQPISACTFAMSGTRRYMSSKPSAYASS